MSIVKRLLASMHYAHCWQPPRRISLTVNASNSASASRAFVGTPTPSRHTLTLASKLRNCNSWAGTTTSSDASLAPQPLHSRLLEPTLPDAELRGETVDRCWLHRTLWHGIRADASASQRHTPPRRARRLAGMQPHRYTAAGHVGARRHHGTRLLGAHAAPDRSASRQSRCTATSCSRKRHSLCVGRCIAAGGKPQLTAGCWAERHTRRAALGLVRAVARLNTAGGSKRGADVSTPHHRTKRSDKA